MKLTGLLASHRRHVALAAAALGLAVGWRSGLILALLLAAVLLAAVICPKLTVAAACAAAALLLGVGLANARLSALDDSRLAALVGHAVAAPVSFRQAPRAGPYGWSAAATLYGAPVLLRGSGPPPPITIGQIARGEGSLRPLGPNDGWLASQHIGAILRLRQLSPPIGQRGGLRGVVDGVRRRATTAIDNQLPSDQAALMRGMTLGDESAIDASLRTAMRRSGLGHLVAASGTNVALLVTLVFALSALLGAPLAARLVLAGAAVAFYIPLAGSGPSIQRAGVMGLAALVAIAASRPAARWYALLLAAALTLAYDPLAAEQVGWQLSFAAVAGIALLAAPLRDQLEQRSLPPLLSEPLALTAAATIGSAPVAAASFGTVSLVSLPANLAAVALVAPVTWLGMLAALLAQLAPPLAAPLLWLSYWPLSAIVAIADFSAAVPAAQVASGAAPVALCALCAALLIRFPLWRRRGFAVGAALIGALSVVALLSRGPAPLAAPVAGVVRVSFLDIGQGDATLLQSGDHAALIDSGPPDGPIVERLRQAGVSRLDLLVATHAQADHLGGADKVIEAMPVAALLDGRDGVREPEGVAMQQAARRRNVPLITAAAGDSLEVGSFRLQLRSPPGDRVAAPGADPNQRALVVLATAPGLRLLLTADAESDVLFPLVLPTIDLLKVSHHGSADEGLPRLLAQLRPRLAVIEVGAGNSYGHPTKATLAALADAGAEIRRTDKDGTVRVEATRSAMHVQPAS